MTRNYQITIPYWARKELGIEIGAKLLVQVEGDKIIISKKTGDIASLGLTLGRKITEEEIDRAIDEAGREIGSGS
ncbi:Prevent host death protein, Phd antitoxin like [Conexivisphaera calida]|uniref:Prevent host death protein, Phd antitoxin like n=1 Tax=Conexivisphaera calida TaxID=1874277 RepID=A0A4P2VHX7_9ARCH|nr:Prevent host death protein, Phd antitoxin like [Conexivisphaera calida]